MNPTARIVMTGKSARRGFIALALVALSLLLARPVCEAFEGIAIPAGPLQVAMAGEAGGVHDDSVPCCTYLDHGSLGASSTAPSFAGNAPGAAAPAANRVALSHKSQPRSPSIPPDRPPVPASYHARTARILI